MSYFKVCILFLFLLCGVSYPFNQQIDSLQWQKMELRKSITKIIDTYFEQIIPGIKYILNIKIEIVERSRPDFSSPSSSIDNNKDQKEEKKEDGKLIKKSYLNPANLKLEQSKADNIIFSKFGLEAPIVDKLIKKEKKK